MAGAVACHLPYETVTGGIGSPDPVHVESVNVGKVKILHWKGRQIRTGFRKEPIHGRVPLMGVNLRGDDQADRSVHGGPRKAVYVYPSEHYSF
ncbi:MAG: hypothetical protein WCB18_10215 [Thermoplasmata archaeon]